MQTTNSTTKTTPLNYGGSSFWSDNGEVRKINILKIEVEIVDDKQYGQWGFLNVYFDKNDWDVEKDGLIYTDRLFEEELINYLSKEFGFEGEISYSEQGMQGKDFVNFDINYNDAVLLNNQF